ncbi:MAG: ABC-2 transporter permease [Tissierella sp.]|nr:ABC-2 transporter permease [Tissierella sp.]
MKTLIKKDVKIVGTLTNMMLILLGFMFGLLIVLIHENFIRILLSSVGIFLMVGAAFFKMLGHDYSKKTDMFLNSLPLDKEIIVASRYVTILIYVISSSLFLFIASHSYRGVFINNIVYPINIKEVINIISVSILIMAFYLPICYAKGEKNLRSNNASLFITIISILILKSSDNSRKTLYSVIGNIDLSQVSLILIILSIIAYIVSLNFSIKLYKSQEF